jgi:tetratricopeptide (TPR) repeat protein
VAAERYAASLPPRLKNLVAFHRAYEDNNHRRARAIAEDLIARDSTDVEAWYQLGESHFHGGGQSFPHSDTLGNNGKALRAFQRALALDSTYILAYRHIIDALGNCVAIRAMACGADSAVYGTPDSLTRMLGADSLERLRLAARNAQIATARGWVTTPPSAPQPRLALVQVLYGQGRYDEALTEIDALGRLGESHAAGVWKGLIYFQRGQPGLAAAIIDSAFRQASDTVGMITGVGNFVLPAMVLSGGGGRVAAGERIVEAIFRWFPADSAAAMGNVMLAKADIRRLSLAMVHSEAATAEVPRRLREVQEIMTRATRGDSTLLRQLATTNGASSVSAYVATQDTTYLTRFLAYADTIGSATWRVADAALALARGDTARARARVDRHYRTPAPTEFSGEQGMVRSFGWGVVLAELGEPAMALEAFARIDTAEARLQHPGLLVRSFAERGEIYQRQGDLTRAVEYYDKFIAAWENADPELQPQVDRVRKARAAVRLMTSCARFPRRSAPTDSPSST